MHRALFTVHCAAHRPAKLSVGVALNAMAVRNLQYNMILTYIGSRHFSSKYCSMLALMFSENIALNFFRGHYALYIVDLSLVFSCYHSAPDRLSDLSSEVWI